MKKPTKYRVYEILPGLVTWLVLVTSIILSFWKPIWVIYFIIVFDIYWLSRVLYFVFFLVVSWRKFNTLSEVHWMERLEQEYGEKWRDYIHLVFLPTYTEPLSVIETTLEALKSSSLPAKQLWVIVGFEARDQTHAQKMTDVQQKYGSVFHRLTVTSHVLQDDELAGKSANAHYMGQTVKRIVDKEGLEGDKLIVSNFDIDTVVHPHYFAYLTHAFLSHPRPHRASFQPIAVYNNNLWSAPSFTRIVANSTTFWLMTELSRPDQMFTFSSHSMSWKALVDVGFWDKTIVTEDSRIFIQCYMRYDGDYEIVPLYIPVSMDTVVSNSFKNTIRNQYKQILRWAYSVEHFPYMMYHFAGKKNIPRKERFKYIFKLGEGLVSWATAPFIILVLGRLPLYIAGAVQDPHVLVQNAPFVLEWLMRIAMIGILASATFNVLLIPHKEIQGSYWKPIILVLQWIFLPITMIVFGSIPAVHAQTRLALGKYMGFWNTEKLER